MKKDFSKKLVNEFPRIFTEETCFSYDDNAEELKCVGCCGGINLIMCRGKISVEFFCNYWGYEFLDHFSSKNLRELSDWVGENWSKYDDRDIIPNGTSDWYVRSIRDDEDDLPF